MMLEIDTRVVGEIEVVDMVGRLWIQNLRLQKRVHELLEQGHRFFVLNIARIDYIDSTGLGQLISLWTSVRSRNGNMNLPGPAERVRYLLRLGSTSTVPTTAGLTGFVHLSGKSP